MPKKRLDFYNLFLSVLFVGISTLCLIGACSPPTARTPGKRAMDTNSLRQVAIALLNYAHQNDGILPPPYVADAQGKPLYSWRVLILPYLDRDDIYQAFHLDEPWNSLHNKPLSQRMLKVLQQVNENPSAPSITNYVVVRGPGTLFPYQGKVRLDEVADGTDKTIMVVSLTNSDIHWAEPRDLDIETMSFQINDPKQPSISRAGSDGALVGFADAHVQYLYEGTPPEAVQAALTIAGGEKVELP